MNKLILSLLLVLGLAGTAEAQSLGPGRCAFPNCTTGTGGTGDETATFTPTAARWTGWNGLASTTYDTLQEALNSLAAGVTAAYGAWTGQWSYVVDLTNRVYYDCTTGVTSANCLIPTAQTNPFLNVQRGLNNYYHNAALTDGTQYRMLVIGLASNTSGNPAVIQWTDPNALCPYMAGNEIRRCMLLAPSTTYVTAGNAASDWENGFPVGDAGTGTYTANLYLHFQNVFFAIKENTMVKPTVMFQIGNGYDVGLDLSGGTYLSWSNAYPDGGNAVGPSGNRMLIDGQLSISGGGANYPNPTATNVWSAGGVTGDAQAGGRPNGLPFWSNWSPTGWLGLFLSHANYVDMGDFHLRCSMLVGNAADYTGGDDVCAVVQATNFSRIGSILSSGGTGVISYGSNQGWIRDLMATSGKIGVQLGDPYIGANWTASPFCHRGFKITPNTNGFVVGDVGKALSWATGETGEIVAVTDATPDVLTYKITATNDATLSDALITSGDTVTCTGCATVGTFGTTQTPATYLGAACGTHKDHSVGDLQIESAFSVEGNTFGNLVVYEAYKSRINGSWFEQAAGSTATEWAPSVNVGAGVCDASNYEPCWNYCPAAGVCKFLRDPVDPWTAPRYTTTRSQGAGGIGDLTLTTGNCKGGKLFNTAGDTDLSTWSHDGEATVVRRSQVAPGVALGPGFMSYRSADAGAPDPATAKLTIEGCWGPTDIDTAENSSDATCDDAEVECRLFVANHDSATGLVDASHAFWRNFGPVDNNLPGVWSTAIGATPITYWYQNSMYPQEQDRCLTVEALMAANDNYPVYTSHHKSIVMEAACRCTGTCTTPAVLTWEDQAANALTQADCTRTSADVATAANTACGYASGTAALVCQNSTAAGAVWQPFNTGNLLAAGETLQFDVGGGPTEGDTYNICVREVTGW